MFINFTVLSSNVFFSSIYFQVSECHVLGVFSLRLRLWLICRKKFRFEQRPIEKCGFDLRRELATQRIIKATISRYSNKISSSKEKKTCFFLGYRNIRRIWTGDLCVSVQTLIKTHLSKDAEYTWTDRDRCGMPTRTTVDQNKTQKEKKTKVETGLHGTRFP